MPATMIANRRANLLGHLVDLSLQLLRGQLGPLRAGHRGVQLRNIGGMVFRVVNLHGLGVDVRFQRVVRVRQLGQLERPRSRLGGKHITRHSQSPSHSQRPREEFTASHRLCSS